MCKLFFRFFEIFPMNTNGNVRKHFHGGHGQFTVMEILKMNFIEEDFIGIFAFIWLV